MLNKFIKSIMAVTNKQQQAIDNRIIIDGLTEKYSLRRQLYLDKRVEVMLARRAYESRLSLEGLRRDQIAQSHQDRQYAMDLRTDFIRTVAPAMINAAKQRYEFDQHFRAVLPIYREAAGVGVGLTPNPPATFDDVAARR